MAYLDHAATTPMFGESVRAMSEALAAAGNASSLHASGRRARRTVEESRESIAAAIGAHPSEVIFTAGGTESDNLALKGMYWARGGRRRILVSAVEHHAVLDTVQWLADQQGAELVVLPVDALGRVTPEALRTAIEADPDAVALVSVMLANNEVGTVNPVRALAEVAAEYGIPLHTDAVQAAGMLPIDFAALGASAMTLTGHKLGGPHGAGLLVLRRDVACTPVLHGGGQEREVRSGTLDLPAIVGLASAVGLATRRRAETAETVARLRDSLVHAVLDAVPDALVNGAISTPANTPERVDNPALYIESAGSAALPGIANFTFPGCSGEALLMLLDAAGIECSMGSACTAGVAAPSHVLLGMGVGAEAARSSLRFSLGHTSTEADVSALAEAIGPLVAQARGPVKSLRSKEKV